MADRRQFLKTTLALVAGMTIGAVDASADVGPCPRGLLYSESDPGMWSGKEKSHVPQVSLDGGKVTIETNHPMSNDHYIVRHTLVSADGKVIGAQVFTAEDKPKSTYAIPGKGEYYATSFCNLHDLWVTKFTI